MRHQDRTRKRLDDQLCDAGLARLKDKGPITAMGEQNDIAARLIPSLPGLIKRVTAMTSRFEIPESSKITP